MKLLPARPEHMEWICARAGCVITAQATGMCAVDSKGFIRGMVVYDSFAPNACQVHMAVDTPIAWRTLIPACFIYPFKERGLGVCIGVAPAGNVTALRMARSLGFRETYRVRDGWAPGEDMVIQELRREDCERWLRPAQETVAHG